MYFIKKEKKVYVINLKKIIFINYEQKKDSYELCIYFQTPDEHPLIFDISKKQLDDFLYNFRKHYN